MRSLLLLLAFLGCTLADNIPHDCDDGCDECDLLFDPSSDFMQGCGQQFDDATLEALKGWCSLCPGGGCSKFAFFQTLNTFCKRTGEGFTAPTCDCEARICWKIFDEDDWLWLDCARLYTIEERRLLFNSCMQTLGTGDVALFEQFKTDTVKWCKEQFRMNTKFPMCPVTTTAPPPLCSLEEVDIVIAVDGSGSIDATELGMLKQFIIDLVNSFEIAQDKTRIGIVEFADSIDGVLEITDVNDANDVINYVNSDIIDCGTPLCLTNTPEGIDRSLVMFNTIASSTNPKFLVVLTDGLSNVGNLPAAVSGIGNDITVLVVGIDQAVQTELNLIAGGGNQGTPVSNRVFMVGQFNELESLLDGLRQEICV